MNKQFIRFALLLAVLALVVVTGVEAQKNINKDKAALGKATTAATARTTGTGQCSTPRPPNRGCKFACKPCQVPVCESGKWVYERIEIDKELCRPYPNNDGGACTIGATDYCPPSCKSCIRQ